MADSPDTASRGGVVCLAWRPLERNTLKGFARIHVPAWHFTIIDVAVHESHGKRWAQLPARPQLDDNRELIREADGRIRYARILEFDRDTAARFSAAVVNAVTSVIAAQ